MSMLRSLDSAVTGLRNHQVRMDIIGNNIANINTVGYKSSRLTFEESLSQLLQGSTRPPGDSGGTNPVQVGLGMGVGSVDTKFTQGNLEATGQVTDIAIEGNAFFGVSNGEATYYTRNGAFQLDALGNLVLPTNGFILQGRMAAVDGTFPPGTVIEDITLPLNQQSPAHATQEISLSKNLDSDSVAKGSVDYSQSFMHHAEGDDLLTSLSNNNGESLGIRVGDTLTISALDSNGIQKDRTVTVQSDSSLQGFVDEMQDFLRDTTTGLGITTAQAELVSRTEDLANPGDYRGGISIFNNVGSNGVIQNFQINSDNIQSKGKVLNAFSVPSTIQSGATKRDYMTDFLRGPAQDADLISEVYDSQGRSLGFENGDEIQVTGEIGGTTANNLDSNVIYGDGSNGLPATTMNELLEAIKDNFKLPQTDETLQDNPSVSLNRGGTDDNIPDGSIVVRGVAGKDFDLSNISLMGINQNSQKPSPTNFTANMAFTRVQEARDPKMADTSITVFDESGDAHIFTLTFIPTNVPGNWKWQAGLAGDEVPISGTQGDLAFKQDGSVSSFTFEDDSTQFSFDPNNGSAVVNVRMDAGGPKNFSGLTQFRAPTTAAITGQDGYTTGYLREISIGEDGIIDGIFTNGEKKSLAQIMLVDFSNPGGLMKVSDSVFAPSGNSGEPVYTEAGPDLSSRLKPGALETSNVELALEFTEMITTQRGYQANARGISISDSLLEELVNLKR